MEQRAPRGARPLGKGGRLDRKVVPCRLAVGGEDGEGGGQVVRDRTFFLGSEREGLSERR